MSLETLCQICEAARAEHQCSRCGRMVCAAHYDEASGRCTDCAGETRDRSR